FSKKYFADRSCIVIFSDRENRLWVGTTDGTFMEKLNKGIVRSFPVSLKNGKNSFAITSLAMNDRTIFAGTDRSLLLIIDKRTLKTTREIYFGKDRKSNVVLTDLFWIDSDTLWIATTSGLDWLNVRNYITGKPLTGRLSAHFIFKDKANRIWVITDIENNVYRYDPGTNILDSLTKKNASLLNVNTANSLAEDKAGNKWLGGDAIARWNNALQKIDTLIQHIPTQKNRKKGFTVMNDSRGDIWVSINDDGFAKITGAPIHLRPANVYQDFDAHVRPAMFGNIIYSSTTDGIGLLNTVTGKSIVLNTDDGVPADHITSFQFTHDQSDGSVWFGCRNFVCHVPSFSERNIATHPSLRISDILVGDDSIIDYPVKSVVVPFDRDNLKIGLMAINYTDPLNMRFAYRLKNKKDSSWIDLGTQKNILLTSLYPGSYELEAKVYAYDNKWPEQRTDLKIIINPPFWRTLPFLATVGILLLSVLYYLYRYRIRQIRQKANLDKLLAQTEMKALHAQMNPHFIFNCLNSIREMILNNENMQASHYLSKFAQVIRITLDNSTRPFISLEDSVDYLQRYLEMEKIRTENFTYSIEVDRALEPQHIFLPPMLIQPFIENAIWHGQVPGKSMQLIIRFLKKGNSLVCIIEDDGIGIETSLRNKQELHHQSVGIANIRQRIQLLNEKYDLNSTVLVEDKSTYIPKNGTGTKVTLHLPVKSVET
ncbi:MAG TPA: histidine kinase, partial [Chitinophagaceae bacterium]|nr:histidine kinase [Chitinophagaceae bacterium]